MTAALLQAAAFPAAGLLIAWALIRLEWALWNCDVDEYCDPQDEPETS